MLGPEIFIDSPTPTNNATHAAAHATHTQTAAQATHTAVEELARYPTSSDQSTNHQNQNDTDMSETQNEMLTVDAECIEMQASNPEPHISVSTEDHAESRPPELLFLYEERETVGVAPDVALDVESALDVISRGQLGDKTEFLAYPSAEITLNPGIHRSGTRFPPRNLEDGRPSNQLETRGRSSLIGRRGTQFPRSKTAGITLSSSFSGLEEVAFGIPEQKGEVAPTEDRLPQEEDVLPAAGAPLSYAAPTEIQAERPRSQVLPHKGQQMPQEAPAFPPEVGPTTQTDAVAPNVMSAAMSIEQAHHDLQGLHSDDTERVTQRLLPASSDSACGTLMSQGVKEIVGIRSGTEEVALPSDFLVVVPAEAAQAANGLQSDSASPKTKVPCLFSDRDVAGKRPIAGPSSQYRSSQGCSSSPPPLQLQLPTSAHLKLKRGKEADADLQLNPPTKRDQPEASSTLEKIGQNGVTVKYEWSSSASVQGFLKTYIEGDPPFNLPFCILFDYEITFFHDDDEGVAKWRQTLQDAFSRHLPICQPDKSVSRYSPLTQPELQDLTTQRRKIPLYIPTGKIFNNAIPISGEGTQREAKRRGREGGRKDGTTLNFLVSSDEIIQIPAYSLETKDWVLHSWRRS